MTRQTREIENMEKLFQMIEEKKPEDILLKAELARELGKFDKAKELLDFPFEGDDKITATFIRDLVSQKKTDVYKLPDNLFE